MCLLVNYPNFKQLINPISKYKIHCIEVKAEKESLSTSMVNTFIVTQLDRPLLGKLCKAAILNVLTTMISLLL